MANEIRLRTNNISGATNDNPLAIGATTINSPSFADLPAVGVTNHLILILDPLEVYGAAEIVMVTAHTALATSVTVVRAAEGTTARAHVLGTNWFHGPVASDWTLLVTSGTRPAVPYEGEQIYETDTHRPVVRDNTQWLPGGGVAVVTAGTRPANPYTGQTIFETDTARTLHWNGTQWTPFRVGSEPDQLFGLGLSNGSATSFTAFFTNNAVITGLPYQFKMIVECHVNSGANSAANIVTLQIQDEAGVQISPKSVIDGSWRQDNQVGSQAECWSLIAEKDYAAAATAGFRVAYKVNTSNIFLDGIARVSFVPR